jgi:hypothetical protein
MTFIVRSPSSRKASVVVGSGPIVGGIRSRERDSSVPHGVSSAAGWHTRASRARLVGRLEPADDRDGEEEAAGKRRRRYARTSMVVPGRAPAAGAAGAGAGAGPPCGAASGVPAPASPWALAAAAVAATDG